MNYSICWEEKPDASDEGALDNYDSKEGEYKCCRDTMLAT